MPKVFLVNSPSAFMLSFSIPFLSKLAVSLTVNTGIIRAKELIVLSGLLWKKILDLPKIDSMISEVASQA